MKKIFLGTDHRGFQAKERQKIRLLDIGYDVEDLGAFQFDPDDDYTDYAHAVAERVSNGEGVGILFCASGEGMVMAANRHPDVRASLAWNPQVARESREDNDANVLALPAEVLTGRELDQIIDEWLSVPFSGEERHQRRIEEIEIVNQ